MKHLRMHGNSEGQYTVLRPYCDTYAYVTVDAQHNVRQETGCGHYRRAAYNPDTNAVWATFRDSLPDTLRRMMAVGS